MNSDLNKYRDVLRKDLRAFIYRSFCQLNPTTKYLDNWHIAEMASSLEGSRRGSTRRLIINLPPRNLKSHAVSVAFPAWILGHNPSAQIICASYAQELATKLAIDCRSVMTSRWYQRLFPTRLSSERQAVADFRTTQRGFRMATSVGGTLTGRGADFIIIDDPLKPDEAPSDAERKKVNEWFDHTLYSRLNDKRSGCIIVVMQRLHEDDLVGHVLGKEPWTLLRFPAIAEEDESHVFDTPYGERRIVRRIGEALHPDREPLEVLTRIRESIGDYSFAGQYQQAPAPLGGGLVKQEWFKIYAERDKPSSFEMILQSWDCACKVSELNDYSVCTTWGLKDKHLYLQHVYRMRLAYPDLKRVVREQANAFNASAILTEDKSAGTQLIQELVGEGVHAIKRYVPTMDKTIRMHSVSSTIENGFVHLPEKASWLGEYLHELASFPKAKFDDQEDSTSQALDWFKNEGAGGTLGLIEYFKELAAQASSHGTRQTELPQCPNCITPMKQRIPGGHRCMQCGAQWPPPGTVQPGSQFTRADVLNRIRF